MILNTDENDSRFRQLSVLEGLMAVDSEQRSTFARGFWNLELMPQGWVGSKWRDFSRWSPNSALPILTLDADSWRFHLLMVHAIQVGQRLYLLKI